MTMFFASASIVMALAQASSPAGQPARAPSSSASPVGNQADVVTPKDAKERMELARKVNGLQGLNIPWHLKARYAVLGIDGNPKETGTYEEWRDGDKHYRIAFHSPSISEEEFGTDHGVFRTGENGWPSRPLSAIPAMIARPVRPLIHPEKTEFENYERKFGGPAKQPCTAVIVHGVNTSAIDAESYCFATTNAALLYSSLPNRTYQTLYRNIVIIDGQCLAKEMQLFIAGRPWLNVQIETIEGLTPTGLEALAVPADAKPVTIRTSLTGEITNGHLVKKLVPSYPSAAKLQGIQGTVLLNGIIGVDGHFKQLQVLAGPPMLQQPAIDAVQQWVYSPYLMDGQPIEVETDINVVFALGR